MEKIKFINKSKNIDNTFRITTVILKYKSVDDIFEAQVSRIAECDSVITDKRPPEIFKLTIITKKNRKWPLNMFVKRTKSSSVYSNPFAILTELNAHNIEFPTSYLMEEFIRRFRETFNVSQKSRIRLPSGTFMSPDKCSDDATKTDKTVVVE